MDQDPPLPVYVRDSEATTRPSEGVAGATSEADRRGRTSAIALALEQDVLHRAQAAPQGAHYKYKYK